MTSPLNPALYLYLQSKVGVSDTAGYTRLLGEQANLQHYLEFANSAIQTGTPIPAAETTANLPVDANIRLYFSDPAYGPLPPPSNAPVGPIHPPVRPAGGPLPRPVLTDGYAASDGTLLNVEKARNGQITGFSGTGNYQNSQSSTFRRPRL